MEGLNPLLDAALQAGNLKIYKKSTKALFKAAGVIPLTGKGLKSDMNTKPMGYSPEQIDTMVKGVIAYGVTLYGAETLAAFYPFFETFQDEGLSGVNDMIFTTPKYTDTKFSMMV